MGKQQHKCIECVCCYSGFSFIYLFPSKVVAVIKIKYNKRNPQPFSEDQSFPAGLMLSKNYLVKIKEISRKPVQIQMCIFPDGRYQTVLKTTVLVQNKYLQ